MKTNQPQDDDKSYSCDRKRGESLVILMPDGTRALVVFRKVEGTNKIRATTFAPESIGIYRGELYDREQPE